MSSIGVSVIMPIYKTGELLRDSIESILDQSFKGFELICVDDGSDDPVTSSILREYKARDSRINIISLKENHGAGFARNEGYKVSSGKYCLFFDSDDRALPGMIKEMYDLSEKESLDLCICESYSVDFYNKGLIAFIPCRQKKGVTDHAFQVKELGDEALCCWNTAPWNKLVRRSLIEDHDICFQNTSTCNDVYFTLKCALKADRIMYCNPGKPLVEYRIGRDSQITFKKEPSNLKNSFQALFSELDARSEFEYRALLRKLVYLAIGQLHFNTNDVSGNELYNYVRDRIVSRGYGTVDKYEKLFSIELYKSRWFDHTEVDDVDIDRMIDEIDINLPIVVWGYGGLGMKLDKVLNERGNSILVTDIKNIMVGCRTRYGSEIIDYSIALKMNANIISTKKEINQYLYSKKEDASLVFKLITPIVYDGRELS